MFTTLYLSLVLSGAGPELRITATYPDFVSCGSGTVVAVEQGKSLVLTNRHVVPDKGAKITVSRVGLELDAELVSASETADLAVLVVKAELPTAILSRSVPNAMAPVYYRGYPGGGDQRLKRAIVHGVNGHSATQGVVWWIRARAEGGDSGSGVFGNGGELVGVVWGVDGVHTAAVHLSEIYIFLYSVSDGAGFKKLHKRLDGGAVAVGKTEPLPEDR